MEERGIKLIREILGDSTADFAEKIYHLIKEKNLDKTRLRNALIIRDYDNLLKLGQSYTDIHWELSENYDMSPNNIRYIISNRKFNEL